MTYLQKIMLVCVLGLTACADKPEPAPSTTNDNTESVPMSAEPAEPTGVMNAEPVNEPSEPLADVAVADANVADGTTDVPQEEEVIEEVQASPAKTQ